MPTEIYRRPDILARLGISRTGLRNMIHDGRFPKPTGYICRDAVWPAHMVDAWLAAKLGEAK